MSRFVVYEAPDIGGYLMNVQSEFITGLNTRVVVPMHPVEDVPRAIPRLNPVFEVNGRSMMLVPQFMSAVPVSVLKVQVADLSHEAERVTAAVDFLMQGF